MKRSTIRSRTRIIFALAAVSLLMAACYRHYPAYGHGYGSGYGNAYSSGYGHGHQRGNMRGGYGSHSYRGKY